MNVKLLLRTCYISNNAFKHDVWRLTGVAKSKWRCMVKKDIFTDWPRIMLLQTQFFLQTLFRKSEAIQFWIKSLVSPVFSVGKKDKNVFSFVWKKGQICFQFRIIQKKKKVHFFFQFMTFASHQMQFLKLVIHRSILTLSSPSFWNGLFQLWVWTHQLLQIGVWLKNQ